MITKHLILYLYSIKQINSFIVHSMASLVLILSFLVRLKIKNQASIVTATSFDTNEDGSTLLARGAQQRDPCDIKLEVVEKIPEEPKVCIYLV
ncbi:hypothetical protein VNO78_16295 [Psophocarpus tetragonolobus]|uniref:Uncharacterized protein n=1 Tax=Psophocarpus tetragonolobus TaxID=3891 RepID=A0AAN9XKN5_PSOTE